ncbi:MAG TPA: putative peptidoglycan glycosyltransferase FtsW [Alphaproteobacteria bacterium]|jgi:cell division protein FtsW
MINFARTDTSVLGRWWWTVDRWVLAALLILSGFGIVLIFAASPAVATRIGVDSFFFVRKQISYLAPALVIILSVSLLNVRDVRRLSVIVFLAMVVCMVLTILMGVEIKGARRWISVAGFTLQPSEFIKPAFAVVSAWMLASGRLESGFPGRIIAVALYGLTVGLLLLQPDMGMVVLTSAMFGAQLFIAGIPMFLVGVLALSGFGGIVGAYFVFPHVASRIDRFLDPASGDSYQVNTGLEAFMNGGLFGRGPGEGTVKEILPDAHADFIFAVAGEELGLIACLFIVSLFAFIVLRGFTRMLSEGNLFILLAVTGLLTQFGLQAIIHMSSTLHLIPTKGMTLPLISYGGSSMLGIAFGMGMVLALTRRRAGLGEV